MGMDQSACVGPYVECRVPIGSKVYWADVSERIEQSMYFGTGIDGKHYWLNNRHGGVMTPIDTSSDDGVDCLWRHDGVTNYSIETEINYFASFHAKSIDVLREVYGEPNVSICWGVVRYYS